ncbi:hypothetical protein THAOC_14370 [Thalassiosira oceanica]|uniref:Uncharacterized protein n=1 Tax=Thalassiosira oceanica TaxID=159749 RepID=K0SIR2_THAOC|nr:hypothetical protein THAOC_14370 [Thalassiosira oceanica]|eukprot:EJK64854.1 hypothetical protein THAOC_14370 [Thalassiosira oceanica]
MIARAEERTLGSCAVSSWRSDWIGAVQSSTGLGVACPPPPRRADRTELRGLPAFDGSAFPDSIPGVAAGACPPHPLSRRDLGKTPGRRPRGIRRAKEVGVLPRAPRRDRAQPVRPAGLGAYLDDVADGIRYFMAGHGGIDDNAPETSSDVRGGRSRDLEGGSLGCPVERLDILCRTACWRRQRCQPQSPGATSTEILSAGACEAVAGSATRHPDELAGMICGASAARQQQQDRFLGWWGG